MFDFKITDNGELAFNGGTGQINKVESDELLRQQAICRIKSVTNDWFNEADLGANLEEFLGEVNNQLTSKEVMDRIRVSLSDIIANENNIFIIPKVDRESLSFIVFIRGRAVKNPIVINTRIDIVSGVTVTSDIDAQ